MSLDGPGRPWNILRMRCALCSGAFDFDIFNIDNLQAEILGIPLEFPERVTTHFSDASNAAEAYLVKSVGAVYDQGSFGSQQG